MSKSNSLPARPPRSADATRKRILAAAQRFFSSRGYKDVGLREIAALAGCDTTLIRRYFGSKERLFEAALAETLDDVGALLDGPHDGFGERAVAFFNEERGEVQPVRMLIFATSDTVSRAIALRMMEERHYLLNSMASHGSTAANPHQAERIEDLKRHVNRMREFLLSGSENHQAAQNSAVK